MTIIGIDAGTSMIKVAVFDDDGRETASTTRPTMMSTPRPGWSEQDMLATFDTVMAAVADVVRQSPEPVEALALTAQGDGLWLADHDLAPAGPALLWNDTRAAAIFDHWWRDGAIAEVFGITGSVGGPGSPHALLAWLHANDPARLAGSAVLTCGGWLFARLTGEVVAERADAASPFGDVLAGGWSRRALDAFGLGWAEPMLPRVVDGQARAGTLTEPAAALAGLPAGLPVVTAPYDVVSTAHGAGALDPGDAAIILGTTLCAEVITQSPRLDRPPSGVTLPAAVPGGWLVAQPGLTGTGVIEWAATLLGLNGAAALSDLAATAEPPADRPLVLPYLAPGGERAPFYDPAITGSILGLRSWHQPADIARAVLEGLSLAAADALAAAGHAERVMLAGGGQASALWCQLIAEACGVEVRQVPGRHPGARGAVMCARVLLGHEHGWDDLRRWLKPGTTWIPDLGQQAYWSQARQRFRSAREHLRTPLWQQPPRNPRYSLPASGTPPSTTLERNDGMKVIRPRARRIAALSVVAAALVAGCSSSSSTTSSSGSSGTSGTPLNVMTIAPVNYNGPAFGNILATAKVAAAWINAHGGIQGHPINLTTCDDQGDPTKAAQCAREAVSQHDIAVVGSFSLGGNAIIPVLAAAHIAWFGNCCSASADELTSPDVQQIGSGIFTPVALAIKAKEDGCKHISLVLANSGALATFTISLVKNALKSVNGSAILTKTVLLPLTLTDYGPQVAEATSGTDCVLADVNESAFPSFMSPFVQSGAHQRLYGVQGNLDSTVTKPFPQATENAVIAGSYSDISLPVWANYRAALKTYNAPDLNYNSLAGLGTWAGYMAFQQVADGLKGAINNETFLAAAQKATVSIPGAIPTINFSDHYSGLGGAFANCVNRYETFDVVHNGVPVPWDGGKFFDMTEAVVGAPLPAADIPPAGQNG